MKFVDRFQNARRVLLATLSLLLMVRSACAASATPPAMPPDAPPVKVEIPIFEGGEGTSFFIQCARQFEQQRPGVTVDLYGDPRISDKLRVRILERDYFDVTNATLDYDQLIKEGEIAPLDRWLDGPSWDGKTTWRKTFLPGTLDEYTINGKVYGVPLPFFVYVIWYNKAIFEQHGWTPPRTHSEMLALCEKMKAAGVTPFSFCGRYPYYGESLVQTSYYAAVGPAAYKQQLKLAPGSFDNAPFIDALTYAQQIARNDFQQGALGMSHTEAQTQFFLSHTAMIPCGAWLRSEMMGKIPDGFRLGAFNYPLPDTGTVADPDALSVLTTYYFIMSHAAHPNEAADFLRFMTSQQEAAEFTRLRDIPTAVVGTAEGNLSQGVADLIPIIRNSHESFVTNGSSEFPEIEQDFNDMLGQLIDGKITPQQAAAQMEAGAATIREHLEHPDRVTIKHLWQPILLLALFVLGALLWIVTAIAAARRGPMQKQVDTPPPLAWRSVLLFVAPAVIIYSVFVVIPSVRSFTWSMHRWNGITPIASMQYIGLENFRRLLFESDAFWTAMGNNLFLMVVVPLFVLPLALFFAACLSRGVWGSSLFRIVFFFPNLLGGVATTLLWMQLYNPVGGPVNAVLNAIGLHGFKGYTWLSPAHLYWSLIPLSVWGACGFNMVLYLAAMQNIPEDLYEAAEIDGASQWRQFWVITMPMIRTIFTVSLVFLVIGGMKAFEVIWLLTNQQPVTANHVVGTLMVQRMFQDFQIGEATAIAVLLFLVVFVASVFTMRLTRGEAYEG